MRDVLIAFVLASICFTMGICAKRIAAAIDRQTGSQLCLAVVLATNELPQPCRKIWGK